MLFDLTMPIFLFLLCFIAIKVYEKIEGKLKRILEEKEFQVKDVIVLVIAMGVMISIMVIVPSLALALLILFAFSMLIFTFLLMVTEKWYLSLIPSAIFVLLYYFGVFWNIPYLWNVYIIDIFAVVFAILITVYLGSLFTWKTTAVFAVLLTAVDIIQVLLTGHMGEVASKAIQSELPLLVFLPIFPPVYNAEQGLAMMGLGLGDLFFAGLLSLQAFKQLGKDSALLSMIGISASFFVFETLLLNYKIEFFPGTLMIVCGWLPLVVIKQLRGASR